MNVEPEQARERERRDLAELDAARGELVRSVTRLIDCYVEQWDLPPGEAADRARRAPSLDPGERDPEDVFWWEITNLLEHQPDEGQALWGAIKAAARKELATASRTARALEPTIDGRPYERAQFLVIAEALTEALQPRDGLEALLVQQMAAAYEQYLRWQARATQRAESAAWQGERDKRRALENMSSAQRERYQRDEGWLPPRLGDAEAIEQAVMIADRFQRAFLRLLKAYRDNRRLFGALIVAGGQVNMSSGPQQVNVAPTPAPSHAESPAPAASVYEDEVNEPAAGGTVDRAGLYTLGTSG